MSGEGIAYGSIGNAYLRLGNYLSAKTYYDLRLKIAQAVTDRSGEGRAYSHLGHACCELKDYTKAIDYYELHLEIAQEVKERAVEGKAYGNLANAYFCSGNKLKGKHYAELLLKIAKEVEDKVEIGNAFANLGSIFESTDSLHEALEYFKASLKAFYDVRDRLESEDEWKISLRELHHDIFTSLSRILLKLDKPVKALCAAEEGRAQALKDLLKSHYGIQTTDAKQCAKKETPADTLCGIPCNTIFVSYQVGVINTWVIQNDNNVHKRGKEAGDFNTLGEVLNSVKRLVDSTFDAIGVRGGIKAKIARWKNCAVPVRL